MLGADGRFKLSEEFEPLKVAKSSFVPLTFFDIVLLDKCVLLQRSRQPLFFSPTNLEPVCFSCFSVVFPKILLGLVWQYFHHLCFLMAYNSVALHAFLPAGKFCLHAYACWVAHWRFWPLDGRRAQPPNLSEAGGGSQQGVTVKLRGANEQRSSMSKTDPNSALLCFPRVRTHKPLHTIYGS